MAGETSVILPFGDGEYRFHLRVPEIIELERKGECTFLNLAAQLEQGTGPDDAGAFHYLGMGGPSFLAIRETIRLALIGGNHALIDGEEQEVGPIRAKQLVEAYVCPARPMEEAVALAGAIVSVTLRGVRLKKKADEPAA